MNKSFNNSIVTNKITRESFSSISSIEATSTTIDDLNKLFNKSIVTSKIIRESFSSIFSIEITIENLSQTKINKSSFVVIISRRFSIISTIISRRFFISTVFIDSEIADVDSKEFFDVFVFESNSAYLTSEIDFQLINDLFYHVKKNYFKFCIFQNCVQEVLKLVHDDNFHANYHRVYARLKIVYIRKLSRVLTLYIKHCSTCQLNQIKRHKSYEKLMSISSFHLFYHIIIIDFVLILSIQTHDFDCMLIVTNKIIRKHLLIQSKIIWNVVNWANVLLNQFQRNDWNVFAELIFDRDFKFCSNFWRALFDQLNTKLLMSTTYHFQIDDLSKRINQTMKIALRFLIVENSNIDWMIALSALQFRLNNNINAVIDKTFNEIILNFLSREVIIVVVKSFDLKKKIQSF